MKNILASLFLMLSVMACNQQVEQSSIRYFDLKGTFETQIKELSQRKPAVQKSVKVGTTADTQTKVILDWEKELDFFIQADLNKPAFINSYQITQNDSLVVYKLKPTETQLVKEIKLTLKHGELQRVYALLSDENYLYKTRKEIKADFVQKQLKHYEIDGFQQLVFGEKKAYQIKATIQ
ncbi:hypothetical protein QM480_17305 [Flectobacillus sp. DC10W]|uniref:Lipoprotein n=1 Tax=Flectobacillus longus TaxID=2984207 RepID=A0ABT6YR94_9BACT|nr:hypothetical protein [Flectobacillus longus]MDI9866103.1 hypothetical protein [Flectobacillus longus]